MQLPFRYVATALVATAVNVLCVEVAEVSHVTPVQKVITMLTGMLEKGKKERHEEQVQFATYKQFCVDTEATVAKQIKAAEEQINMLQADIQKYKTSNEDLAREVQDLEADHATYAGDEKAATKVREMQRVEYEKVHKDYTESIDAIGKAIQILKHRAAATPQAQQTQEAPSKDVLSLLSLDRVPEASKHAIEAFLAKSEGESNPEAYGYEFQSQGVIDMLEKLRDKFTEERSQLEKDELNERHSYDLLMADLKDSISNAEAAISTKTQQRSKDQQLVATREGDLQDATSTKADDSKYLSNLQGTCTTKSNDFQSRQKLRGDEIIAIEKAIEILSSDDVMGASAKHLPGMLQVSSSLAQLRSAHENPNQIRMAAYLNDQATRIGSHILSAIAIRARDDPFAKVKKMLRDLITRLEEQAGEEAQHKGWCDTELKENEKVRTTRSAHVEDLKRSIDEVTAWMSKEAAEITKLTQEVAELDGNVAKDTEIRQKDKAENEATIQDAKDAQTAVSRAILVLKEFYATAADSTAFVQKGRTGANPEAPEVFDAPYKGMASENGGVIGMLEVIQSDFARLQSDTESAEETAARAHSTFMTESAVSKAQKESDITHKTSQKQTMEQQLTDFRSDLAADERELDAANKYFDKLKPSCLDAGMSFQEREQRRQEEIQSLQEALRILNGEDIASMMQMS